MPAVHFPRHLRNMLPVPATHDAPGESVAEIVDHLSGAYPGLRHYLLDDQGALRQHVNIFIGNAWLRDRTRLSDRVPEGEEVFIMQALSGG